MILIKPDSKTLFFGDGDICVSTSTFGLRFREFEPPVEVGTVITDELEKEVGLKYTSEWFTLPIKTYEEAVTLDKLLDKMDGRDFYYFHFGDFTFNFANWNPKSIEVIKGHLSVVRSRLLMCIAC